MDLRHLTVTKIYWHTEKWNYAKFLLSIEEVASATELSVPSVSLTLEPTVPTSTTEKPAPTEQRLRGILANYSQQAKSSISELEIGKNVFLVRFCLEMNFFS